jgi:hypothetical protein
VGIELRKQRENSNGQPIHTRGQKNGMVIILLASKTHNGRLLLPAINHRTFKRLDSIELDLLGNLCKKHQFKFSVKNLSVFEKSLPSI